MRIDPAFRALSLAVLAFQVYIPWSVPHFTTQDGPAHIYTAFVTKDLIFHRHTSPYHAFFHVQKTPLPNWTCTVLLAGFLAVFEPDHAEAFLTSLCLLVGYASFAYFVGWRRGPPLLFANWLIQSWFLWAGFYNFFLGMALLPLVLAIHRRHPKRYALLAVALVLLFFTHLIPAALALMAVAVLGVWMKRSWKLGLSLVPAAILVSLYAVNFHRDTHYQPEVLSALRSFPRKIFMYASGWPGEQRYLWLAVLLLVAAALFVMSRAEWNSIAGGLAVATGAAFLLYLAAPDVGFGGSVVKMRLALSVFWFGALMVCSVDRLRPWLPATGLLLAIGLAAQLPIMASQVRVTSDAVGGYLAAIDHLPTGARFVRMYFPAPFTTHRFRTDRLYFHPLLHVDELGAVRRHAVALSDYQSATGTFSVVFKPLIDAGHQSSLTFETPGADAWKTIPWLNGGLPEPIDYVVFFGDEGAPNDAPVRFLGANPGTPFARNYRLTL